MLQKDLAGLLAVSETRVSRLMNPLEGLGLATRSPAAGGRLALAGRGLAFLARRDRASVGVARKRWSVSPIDPEGPAGWRNVSGSRRRQLLRNLAHTAAVHRFMAALARQCRALGWETAQLDPPHRASRYVRHQGALRSVNTDAFGILRRGPAAWPFFLEWERRAVRPATMYQRLAPYLRYYSSHRPTDDHGARPAVLVVFDDDIAATHFLTLAAREMERLRVAVPLWVSNRKIIEALGPPGRAWLTPGDWETRPSAPERTNDGPGRGAFHRISFPFQQAVTNHVFTKYQLHERPPGASGTERRPARHGGPLGAAGFAQPFPELAAREIGVSPGYVSMLVNEGRAPSGSIRRRMLKALGVDDFHQLFRLEVIDDEPQP